MLPFSVKLWDSGSQLQNYYTILKYSKQLLSREEGRCSVVFVTRAYMIIRYGKLIEVYVQ